MSNLFWHVTCLESHVDKIIRRIKHEHRFGTMQDQTSSLFLVHSKSKIKFLTAFPGHLPNYRLLISGSMFYWRCDHSSTSLSHILLTCQNTSHTRAIWMHITVKTKLLKNPLCCYLAPLFEMQLLPSHWKKKRGGRICALANISFMKRNIIRC